MVVYGNLNRDNKERDKLAFNERDIACYVLTSSPHLIHSYSNMCSRDELHLWCSIEMVELDGDNISIHRTEIVI